MSEDETGEYGDDTHVSMIGIFYLNFCMLLALGVWENTRSYDEVQDSDSGAGQ